MKVRVTYVDESHGQMDIHFETCRFSNLPVVVGQTSGVSQYDCNRGRVGRRWPAHDQVLAPNHHGLDFLGNVGDFRGNREDLGYPLIHWIGIYRNGYSTMMITHRIHVCYI